MDTNNYLRLVRMTQELDRKIGKLSGIPQGSGRDRAVRSIEKLRRQLRNAKQKLKKKTY